MRKERVGRKSIVFYSILGILMLISPLIMPISISQNIEKQCLFNDTTTMISGVENQCIISPIENLLNATPYDIGLTGFSAPRWIWISYPVNATGLIQNVLNDATYGDGLTTWIVAKWYDAKDPMDPWKSYRVGGTANDMPPIDNTMSFWLYLTANGGDQCLTLGAEGYMPVSTNIELVPGWNMIGYPSLTPRSASSVFGPNVDKVTTWNPAYPPQPMQDCWPYEVTLYPNKGYYVHSLVSFVVTIPGN